jgi:trimeric autotransporter adhesin
MSPDRSRADFGTYTVMKRLRSRYYSFAALALAGVAAAQTKLDLRTQAKSVDFSQADSTRPSKTGTSLPAACAAGETFLKLDGPPGRNWYVCAAGNQWSLQGGEMPAAAPENGNSVLASDGGGLVWRPLGGDVSGAPETLTVSRILGRVLSPTAPASGQVLTWNGSSWRPESLPLPALNSVFGRTAAVTAQAGDYRFDQIGGTILSSQLPPPGGDLSGVLGAATVSRLQNRPLAANAPTTGQVLTWSGIQWEPQGLAAGVTSAFGRTGAITSQTGDYRFDQIGGTVASSQLPPLGGDLSGAPGTATVTRLQNRPLAVAAPATGQILAWSGTQWEPQTVAAGVTSAFGRSGAITAQAGDYSADQIANAVDLTRSTSYSPGARQKFAGNSAAAGLQVAPSTLPTTAQAGDIVLDAEDSNQLKVYDGDAWVGLKPVAAHANYAAPFIGQTEIAVPGSTHLLGTANLIVGCYDNSSPANMIEPSTISVDPGSFDVTVRFPAPQSGHCVINGFNGGAGTGGASSGSGAVNTVFGRSGDVVARDADYAFSQIAGTVANNQVAAGLDASKIGAGLVTNQAFGYLANVASDIQAQLDAKAAGSHSHNGGGDISGALENTIVARIQGRAVSSAAPLDGQILAWNAAANQWQPATGAGGAGGAGMAAQLGDFAVTRTSPAILNIGEKCSAATPCNVRFGSRVHSLTSGAQATLTGGAGTVYIYLTADGALTAGHTMAVTCSGSCVAVSGVTGFPQDSIPLYSWNAAGDAWENSGTDRRSWISRSTLLSGAGIVMVEAGGQTTVAIDSTSVPTYLKNSVSLDFPPIAAGTCSEDLTFALPGALAGDSVATGWPSGLESGLVGTMRVGATNQIAVRLCAMGRDIDPASAIFSATIVRGL